MYSIVEESAVLSFGKILLLWANDKLFRDFFISLLHSLPLLAYRFETPGITNSTLNMNFEFVVLSDPLLSREANSKCFSEYFNAEQVVSFTNLRKDALLVVPCPTSSDSDYSHLAAFMAHSPQEQKHALWEQVGISMLERICDRPLWLSTAGGGVAWLHVRLDNVPKYYRFSEYRANARV